MGRSDLDAGLWEQGWLAITILERCFRKVPSHPTCRGAERRHLCKALEQSEVLKSRQAGRSPPRILDHTETPTAFLYAADAVRHACRYHLRATITRL
jgi:hypothetical protein